VPLLAGHGTYIAVTGKSAKSQDNAKKMLASIPGSAGAQVIPFDPATATMAPAGTVDTVLTFRNVHNLLMPEDSGVNDESIAKAFFIAAFKALKPGGVLGIEDHRLPESASAEREKTSGYVKKSTVVRLATAAGFKLDGESEINANPKDTHDWPKGVWTLPPSLELGEVDRAKYLAIGESDRMTLRFVKPK
jgi:predicted methyltransferase